MRRERDEARRRAMTLLAERESLMEAQQEERIARLKDEEELAELTVAVAALSKNSEDYWEAKFSNNRTKLEEDQSELSKLNELFAEKESYSKLQTLQLIEKEELGASIEMLAGAGEATLEQRTKDLLEELEGVRASLAESTAESEELSKAKSAMQEEINYQFTTRGCQRSRDEKSTEGVEEKQDH